MPKINDMGDLLGVDFVPEDMSGCFALFVRAQPEMKFCMGMCVTIILHEKEAPNV